VSWKPGCANRLAIEVSKAIRTRGVGETRTNAKEERVAKEEQREPKDEIYKHILGS
jgi:hypothetical protein